MSGNVNMQKGKGMELAKTIVQYHYWGKRELSFIYFLSDRISFISRYLFPQHLFFSIYIIHTFKPPSLPIVVILVITFCNNNNNGLSPCPGTSLFHVDLRFHSGPEGSVDTMVHHAKRYMYHTFHYIFKIYDWIPAKCRQHNRSSPKMQSSRH